HVEALLRMKNPIRVVVIEPEPAVAWAALGARRLEGLLGDPRFQLLLTEPSHRFRNQLDTALLSGVVAGGWTLQAFPSYARRHGDHIEELNRWLFDTVRAHRVNVATYQRWMEPWIDNVMMNLKHVVGRPFVDHWLGVWRGHAAILVAAGPSVTPNLPLLASLKGKVPIVAAGSGLGPLVEAGIEPDLVVSVDSGAANYRHFQGRRLSAPLAFSPEVYPRIVDEHRGPLIPMASMGGTSFHYVCSLAGFHPSRIPSGPSVANATLALLRALGANPIVLVGQDLAYPDGRSHAAGVPTATAIDPDRRDLLLVEAVGGGQVPTDDALQAMRRWTERYLAGAPDLRVINTSTMGARILGTEELGLPEAVERLRLDDAAGLTDAFAGPPPEDRRDRPAILALELDALLRRIVDDTASAQRAVEQVADAGRRVLGRLSKKTVRASRLKAALDEFQRRRRRLEEMTAYRHFLRYVLNYRRLVLAQVQHDLEPWLNRYLDACSLMNEALGALRAAAGRHLGTP
ncbi:MAG TPA: 6-hydroxymethylpterin diphosphokinase MptE-like protein, partial [Bacillota bacterium]